MLPDEVYFAFRKRPPLSEFKNRDAWWRAFGHVDAFGYTIDETWFFFEPTRIGTTLNITHMNQEVEERLTRIYSRSHLILSFTGRHKLQYPSIFPMNCASQCAALVGLRAFTPWGLKRKLLSNNAKVIHDQEPERGSYRTTGTSSPEAGRGP